jgi:hypothetical protein
MGHHKLRKTNMKLCKDCRWFFVTTEDTFCNRPMPLLDPDYVYGTTTAPLHVDCMSERIDGECGPSGKYFKEREAE